MNDVTLMKLLNVDFKIKRSGNDGKMKCLIIKDDQTLYRFDCVPSDFIFCYTFLVRFFNNAVYIYIYIWAAERVKRRLCKTNHRLKQNQ